MKKLIVLSSAVLVAGCLASAQEWKLGLGVSYRQFDDVEFNGAAVRNFNELRLLLRAGAALDYNPANLAAVVGDLPGGNGAINVVEGVTVTTSYFGADEGVSSCDQWSPVLTAEYLFMTRDRLSLSAVVNFQYFHVGVGGMSNLGVSNTATLNQYFVAGGNVSPLPLGAGVPYGDIATSGYASNSFSMDLYALDLGLKLAYSFDFALDLFVAAGPSFNLVDVDSKTSEWATYSAPGNPGGTFYSQERSDGGTDVLFGVYAAIGAQYWFNERWGVALEARYDEVFDKVDTDLAELDLSGFSGLGKIIFRF